MRITVDLNKVNTPTNKSLLKASNNFRTPLKEPLGGVTGRGFKGEADEDPCGRVLGPRPFYGDSTVSRIKNLIYKITKIQ